jgi:hypothetical protein
VPSGEKKNDPVFILAAGLNKFITESDITDLPDPDSPTTATNSPRLRSMEKSRSAGFSFPVPGKSTVRFFICKRGSKKIFKILNV